MSSPPPATIDRPSSTGSATAAGWYAEYGQLVYSYLRFHLSSADVAEDVTADTFLKVFRAADRYDPARGNPKVWILRIAQNTLRDHLRRTRSRRQVSIGVMRDLVSDAPSPEERVLWEEQVGLLLAALGEQSARDRELIALRYGSGLETPQIAELLGVREGAVRTRLWRALARLRRSLEDSGS
jgi:RNA polymerase sigma-70 factor (ECF subfamily)